MDLIPLHPKLVHLPIALAVLLPLIMTGVLAAWWRGVLPRRTWWIALALQAVLAVSGFAALRTGEADEERVERLVPEAALEAHEEAAEAFVVAALLVLAVSLGAAVVRGPRTSLALAAIASVGSFAVLGLGYRVGDAGGRLVYQHGAAAAYAAAGSAAPRAAPTGDDDDAGE
jgi:hypothetical protein